MKTPIKNISEGNMSDLDTMFYKQYMIQKQEVQRLEAAKRNSVGAEALLIAILLEIEKGFLSSMEARVRQLDLPI